jgi:hypothetical protein
MLAGLLLLAVVFVLGLYKLGRVALIGWGLYQDGQRLSQEALPLTADSLDVAEAALPGIKTRLTDLHTELEGMSGALALARPFSEYGPLIAASPQLVAAGEAGLDVAMAALANGKPALARLLQAPDGALAATAMGALPELTALLPALAPTLDTLALRLESVPTAGFPPSLAALVEQAPASLALAQQGAPLAPLLPELLGLNGKRTYLLLVQNNEELRATGGFIAALGLVVMENRELAGLDFGDSYEVYNPNHQYPPAPKPMQKYMNIFSLVMRDANWSPDLPTTAKIARAIYKQDTGIDIDGIITIDLNAVKKLVGAIGPLTVAGSDDAITGDNIQEAIKRFWENPVEATGGVEEATTSDWWRRRKDFIPNIAQAALAKVQSGDINPIRAAAAVESALDQRDIQIWLRNEEAQAAVAAAGWDGALHYDRASDFLAIVETNMGYNKANAAVNRAVEYTVDWPEDGGPALATVTITFTHGMEGMDPDCDPTPRYGATYDDMVGRCYFNYLRIYAPGGSTLVSVDDIEESTVTSQRGEHGTQVFAGHTVIRTGGWYDVSFTYELPERITKEGYQLMVQRQSGTNPLPLTLQIDGERYSTTLTSGELRWQPDGE